MVHIDLTKPDPSMTPGIDLWKISNCEQTHAKTSGDRMLSVKFARVSNPQEHIFDTIMLEGKGWSISKRKLAALLGPDFAGELDPLDFVARRLWLATAIESYTNPKTGRTTESLKVNIDELKHAGYQRADDPPAGKTKPEPEVEIDSVPF